MITFITGCSGYLGSYILKELIQDSSQKKIYVLSRRSSQNKISGTIENNKKVVIVTGDITKDEIFDDLDQMKNVQKEVTTIIHGAAKYDLKSTHKENYLTNVLGTQNLINFAKECNSLKVFAHISSIAVAGNIRREYQEDELEQPSDVMNPYAQTKYESEKLVRRACLPAHKIIYRPGAILGDSRDPLAFKADGPYLVFSKISKVLRRLKQFGKWNPIFRKIGPFTSSKLRFPIPVNTQSVLPIIPVDVAAKFISSTTLEWSKSRKKNKELKTYHLFCPDSPPVIELMSIGLNAIGSEIKLRPIGPLKYGKTVLAQKLNVPHEVFDYMNLQTRYNQINFLEQAKKLGPEFHPSFKDYRPIFIKGLKEIYSSEGASL